MSNCYNVIVFVLLGPSIARDSENAPMNISAKYVVVAHQGSSVSIQKESTSGKL